MPGQQATQKRLDYKRKWYEIHKERLNSLRREAYKSDDKFKQQALKRIERFRNNGEEELGPEVPEEIRTLLKTTLSQLRLAKTIGISIARLREMERSGQVTPLKQRGPHGEKRFTPEQALKVMKIAKVSRNNRDYKPKNVMLVLKDDGEYSEEAVYTMTEVGKICIRTRIGMIRLEKLGIVPKTPLILARRRYYTEQMVEGLRYYLKPVACRRITKRLRKIRHDGIIRFWKDTGFLNARLVIDQGADNGNEETESTEGEGNSPHNGEAERTGNV
jgi:DNA-binding transcriptional MerR regulator